MNKDLKYKTVVCGSGIAGTGLLFNAIKKKKINEFLDQGIAFLDKGNDFGAGTIGRYIINSDSAAGVFLESLDNAELHIFPNVRNHELVHSIKQRSSTSVALKEVGELMKLFGKDLKEIIDRQNTSAFFSGTSALSVHKQKGGGYLTRVKKVVDGSESELHLQSSSVVFAMGGKQVADEILRDPVGGSVDLKAYGSKLFMTDHLFTEQGLKDLETLLLNSPNKKIVVIGGSHSAFSSLWLLLNKININFSAGDITLMHRSKLKLFYPTKEEAWSEGYFDFNEDDICPATQRVYRLSGLRQDSRDLLKKIFGIGTEKEARVKLLQISQEGNENVRSSLSDAAVIIPAFGYKPATIPVYDEHDNQLELFCSKGGPLVNAQCQVIDHRGDPIPSLYGIGLASGFDPTPVTGGEASFSGQANGVWMYQNGVGELIYDQIIK